MKKEILIIIDEAYGRIREDNRRINDNFITRILDDMK
jgi:hypothetical protein